MNLGGNFLINIFGEDIVELLNSLKFLLKVLIEVLELSVFDCFWGVFDSLALARVGNFVWAVRGICCFVVLDLAFIGSGEN